MAKITEIKKLKRLYSIKFDKIENEKIYVTEDTIVKFMLSKGADFNEQQIKEITEFADYSRGKNSAIYYLSFKTRTKHEVEKYLIEHEIPDHDIPRILSELEELDLINDRAYTQRYIEGKILAATHGPYHLKQKLQQKGINKDLVEAQLNELFDEDKQLKIAIKLAEKLSRAKSGRLPFKQLKIKISQSLISKGFSYDIASSAIEALELETDEENEQDLLAREAEKTYNRLSKRYEGYDLKNRVSQTLGRKGFDWRAISDILRDYDF